MSGFRQRLARALLGSQGIVVPTEQADRAQSGGLSSTPIGHLAHGDVKGAWKASFLSDIFSRSPRATAVGAYGPMASGYAGLSRGAAPALPGSSGSFSGTDWGQYIAPDPNMGPPQFSAPVRDPSIRYGIGAVDILTAVRGADGLGGFLSPNASMSRMNINPANWRQAGAEFKDKVSQS